MTFKLQITFNDGAMATPESIVEALNSVAEQLAGLGGADPETADRYDRNGIIRVGNGFQVGKWGF